MCVTSRQSKRREPPERRVQFNIDELPARGAVPRWLARSGRYLPMILDVFKFMRLDTVLKVLPTREDAIKSLSNGGQ